MFRVQGLGLGLGHTHQPLHVVAAYLSISNDTRTSPRLMEGLQRRPITLGLMPQEPELRIHFSLDVSWRPAVH